MYEVYCIDKDTKQVAVLDKDLNREQACELVCSFRSDGLMAFLNKQKEN